MAYKAYRYLTGRGDVPSLNALIKSATYRRSEKDIEIFGPSWARRRARI